MHVCIEAYVYGFLHMFQRVAHVFVDVPVKVKHQPCCHFPRTVCLIFWDRFLWDLGLINLARLTDQRAREIYLPSLPPQHEDYKPATILDYCLLVFFFFYGHWRSNSDSQALAHTLMKTCHRMNTHTLTHKDGFRNNMMIDTYGINSIKLQDDWKDYMKITC